MGLFSGVFKMMDQRAKEYDRRVEERVATAYKVGYTEAAEQFNHQIDHEVKKCLADVREKIGADFNHTIETQESHELEPLTGNVIGVCSSSRLVQFKRLAFRIDIKPRKEFMWTFKPRTPAPESNREGDEK